jgi:hypothetical protein
MPSRNTGILPVPDRNTKASRFFSLLEAGIVQPRITALTAIQTVIPSAAGRGFFFPLRSCEVVGLRREESLCVFVPPSSLDHV